MHGACRHPPVGGSTWGWQPRQAASTHSAPVWLSCNPVSPASASVCSQVQRARGCAWAAGAGQDLDQGEPSGAMAARAPEHSNFCTKVVVFTSSSRELPARRWSDSTPAPGHGSNPCSRLFGQWCVWDWTVEPCQRFLHFSLRLPRVCVSRHRWAHPVHPSQAVHGSV